MLVCLSLLTLFLSLSLSFSLGVVVLPCRSCAVPCHAVQDIFRKYPNRYESIISALCENLDTLDEPEAKVCTPSPPTSDIFCAFFVLLCFGVVEKKLLYGHGRRRLRDEMEGLFGWNTNGPPCKVGVLVPSWRDMWQARKHMQRTFPRS